MDTPARLAANEEAVQHFFASWDPAWRWILILGLRQMRGNPVALGALASAEANDTESWFEDAYAYGPLSIGITAAAVNEAAQHCEDLFALLRFLREPAFFAREMANYSAGRVIEFGRSFATFDDLAVSRLFLVPDPDLVRAGLADAAEPDTVIAQAEAGRVRLARMLRETADFYRKFEDFHIRYKHGLELPLRPFGTPTDEAITERKGSVSSPLFVYTTEAIQATLRRGPTAEPMMFTAGPNQQANLSKLVEERNLLRLRMVADVDLDEVADRSYTVLRLLQLAQANRMALGRLEEGNQRFSVPGEGKWEQVDVTFKLDHVLSLTHFSEPAGRRTGGTPARKRRRR